MDLLAQWKTLAKIENARMMEPYEGQKPNFGIVVVYSFYCDIAYKILGLVFEQFIVLLCFGFGFSELFIAIVKIFKYITEHAVFNRFCFAIQYH